MHEMLGICGSLPQRMANTGHFVRRHFDASGNFLLQKDLDIVATPNVPFEPPSRPLRATLQVLLAQAPPDVPQVRHDLLVGHFIDLLTTCLKLNPTTRPSAKEVLQ